VKQISPLALPLAALLIMAAYVVVQLANPLAVLAAGH